MSQKAQREFADAQFLVEKIRCMRVAILVTFCDNGPENCCIALQSCKVVVVDLIGQQTLQTAVTVKHARPSAALSQRDPQQ